MLDSSVYVFAADVVKSVDTLDRGILDLVWDRRVCFHYQSLLALVSLGPGNGEVPQGCRLSMILTAALASLVVGIWRASLVSPLRFLLTTVSV